VDPGPDDEQHLRRILATAQRVERIVLSHRHHDHAGGAERLSELCGAPVLAFGTDLEDGDRLPPGLIALHTPGHAPDHLCFWDPQDRTLLSGDLIAGSGSILVAPPEGDLIDYMASLERIRALAPARILPGHGPEVTEAVAKIEEYIAHRQEREEQVIAALDSGASSVREVVASAYRDVPQNMRPYAEFAVQAHLAKLGRSMPLA
jgi:glyoxylase-like metal-dependent hydrolase (beta-lactamase superfamily II)